MVGNHQTSIYKWLFGVPLLSFFLSFEQKETTIFPIFLVGMGLKGKEIPHNTIQLEKSSCIGPNFVFSLGPDSNSGVSNVEVSLCSLPTFPSKLLRSSESVKSGLRPLHHFQPGNG